MPPKITRLYIHNYRCFVDFELLPEGRSLLLGYNGTGKSSIFDVLSAIQDLVVWNKDARDVFPASTLATFEGSDEQRFGIDVESEWGIFRYTLHLLHDEQRKGVTIKAESVTLEGKPLYAFADGKVQLYSDDHVAQGPPFPVGSRSSFLAALEPSEIKKKAAWLRDFFAGIWILRMDPRRISGKAAHDEYMLGRDGANFGALCRTLLAEAPDEVQRAKETLKEVVGGFDSLRMQQEGRARVLVVRFRGDEGKPYELDFDALSDGQKVLIALYLMIYGVSSRATVFCFDEPDNFVSIREIQPFLVELQNLSEEAGIQFFVISHSSEVINYLGPSEAILLERNDGGRIRVGALAPSNILRLSELMARGWHVES